MIDIDLDGGFRYGAFDMSATYYVAENVGMQAEFIDEGKQPGGIKNVNRVVNLDGVIQYSVGDFSPFIKAGVTTSYFSHNGSGNGYSNRTGFTGGNVGAGVAYRISKHWSANAQLVGMSYQQSDRPGYETFEYVGVGVKYTF